MVDSVTTMDQKRMKLEGIKQMVQYLETHGLYKIKLEDLKDAYNALDRMEL